MNHLYGKLICLWVGNISKWMFYGGEKSLEEVTKEDNETIGRNVTLLLVIVVYFSFS